MNPTLEFIIICVTILVVMLLYHLFKRKKIKRVIISKALKRKIFRKYKHACAICPSTICLEIHHRNNRPNDNREENLILLCHSCHIKTRMKI